MRILAAVQALVRPVSACRAGRTRPTVRWALSLSYIRAHAVPVDAPTRDHRGRPVADGLCGYPGLVDEAGLAAGASPARRRCHGCQRLLDGKPLLP